MKADLETPNLTDVKQLFSSTREPDSDKERSLRKYVLICFMKQGFTRFCATEYPRSHRTSQNLVLDNLRKELALEKWRDIMILDFERRWELKKQLREMPSYFNLNVTEFLKDQNRLLYVYNEIVFKMDTLPDFFKPALVNLIGFIECARGNGKRATRCFLNVKKMDENNVICLANNAWIALKNNNYSAVQTIITEISRLRNTTHEGEIAAEIGHFYQWFGLNCAAKKEYERALEIDPDNLMAIYGMAVVLYELSKHEGRVSGFRYLTRALDLFKKLLRAIPDFTLARIYEGKARNQLINISIPDSAQGDNEADRIFSQVMSTDCAPELLCMIGEEYLKLGMLDGSPSAITIFERALSKRQNSKVYHLLGLAMRAKYFKENPEMHDVFKSGNFSKNPVQSIKICEQPTSEKTDSKEKKKDKKEKKDKPKPEEEADPLSDAEPTVDEAEPSVPVSLDVVIETLSTAVKLSRGANREAVFDLAESLWVAGERGKAVTNFEIATQSENVIIQVKAHQRLAQAFLDGSDLPQAEYHIQHIMRTDAIQKQEDNPLRVQFLKLVSGVALAFIRKAKAKKAEEWVNIALKLKSDDANFLMQSMVYSKFDWNRKE